MASEQKKSKATLKHRLDAWWGRIMSVGITVFIVGAIFGTIHLFNLSDLIETLEQKTYDLRVYLKLGDNPDHKPSSDIVIVKYDDPTLKAMEDEYGTWPWPRSVHADIIEFLNQAGAKAIAFDIMFVGKIDPQTDQVLIDAFKNHDNVYLSMNFDNNKFIADQLGKGVHYQDVEKIQPIALDLDVTLNEKQPDLVLKHGFYDNDAMTFNSFRRIMAGLMDVRDRIGFINHGRDKDGVSRSNPIFFRYLSFPPIPSEHPPFVQDPETQAWHDAQGQAVNEEGYLLDDAGRVQLSHVPIHQYYPYLGLKLLLDLAVPASDHQMTLTPDGRLQFGDYDIPLYRNGSFLINWYNTNVEEEAMSQTLGQLTQYREELRQRSDLSPTQKQEELLKLEGFIAQYRRGLERNFEAQPYKEISAWEIFRSMRDLKDGVLTEQDKSLMEFFKDKVVFVGTTAVSTYDIKTTPINKLLPGVVLQATVFDNLYQNKAYMRRASSDVNVLLTALLCLMSSVVIFRLRSAVSGLLTVMALGALYLVVAVFALKYMSLWINIAMPIIALAITTIAAYMIKYVNRDKDYRRTYKLATTDGLTGLYNHRYFQEHLTKSIDFAKRFNSKFSLLLLDIDFFKKFNDTYGHQAGDEVLRQVALKLKNSVRSIDLVARYGGEEMAVILEKASEEEALDVARKLVRLVGEEPYEIMDGVFKHVTISVGVATYPSHGLSPAELIEFSDKGLYRAKENGRNQVGPQFDEDMPTAPPAPQEPAPAPPSGDVSDRKESA